MDGGFLWKSQRTSHLFKSETSWGKGPNTMLVGKGPGPSENHNTRDMDGSDKPANSRATPRLSPEKLSKAF